MKVKRSNGSFAPFSIVIAIESEKELEAFEEFITAADAQDYEAEEVFDLIADLKKAAFPKAQK